MNPTTEKINIGQNDYNNLADWAKPNYQVQNTNTALGGQSPATMPINAPLTMPAKSMSADSLLPTPSVKVPQTQTPDTTASGVVASTQPSVDTALQNFEQAKSATGTQAEDSRTALTKMAENIFGQKADAQANQVNLENQAGLLEEQKVLGQINTQIANEQVGLRNEEEKIRQGYGTEAQKQISRQTLLDTYGRRLADLAIRQSAATSNITAIRDNAERQTKLLTAPLDTKIQYLSTFAKDNVDYLDKKQTEKLAFIVDDLKSQKQDIQALQKVKTDLTMEISNNGGGTDTALIARLQAAKTPEEASAIAAASGYVGKLDRQLKNAQLANIYSEIGKRNAEIKAVALEKQGTQGVIPGQKPIGKPDNTLATFANRVTEANNILNSVEGSSKGNGLVNYVFTSRKAEPALKATEYKQYDQARDNFITAVLRKESGAAIGKDEYETADRQYFAQTGDSPEVVLQKQRNRIDTLNGMIAGAGTAYNGTFKEKPLQYKNASYEPINPFTQTLQNNSSTANIYNSATGYQLPK